MSMYTLLRNNAMPTEEEMEKAFEGTHMTMPTYSHGILFFDCLLR